MRRNGLFHMPPLQSVQLGHTGYNVALSHFDTADFSVFVALECLVVEFRYFKSEKIWALEEHLDPCDLNEEGQMWWRWELGDPKKNIIFVSTNAEGHNTHLFPSLHNLEPFLRKILAQPWWPWAVLFMRGYFSLSLLSNSNWGTSRGLAYLSFSRFALYS